MLKAALGKKAQISFIKELNCRIANEIIRCNIIKLFYPYFTEDNLLISWNKSCKNHWEKVASCKNLQEYYLSVCQFMHIIKDSHVDINFSLAIGKTATYSPSYYPALEVEITNNKTLIIHSSNPLLKGYNITKINNIPTTVVLNQKMKNISYSHHKAGIKKLSSNYLFKSLKKDSVIQLTLQKDEQCITYNIKTDLSSPYTIDTTNFIEFVDSIAYINLTSGKGEYNIFKNKIDEIKNTKGIIFDMRGYVQPYTLSILSNIIKSKVSLGNLTKPISFFPGQLEYIPVNKWDIYPALSKDSEKKAIENEYQTPIGITLQQPCVFLMDYTSTSFTETLLDIIKTYKLGTIVGENSAGYNGDIMFIKLPFASFTISGYKFMNRDFFQHHGKGIVPDIYVINNYNHDEQLKIAKKYYMKKWEPVLLDKPIIKLAKERIDIINNIIIEKSSSVEDLTLYTGKLGMCLFLYYYSLVNKKNNIWEEYFYNLNNDISNLSTTNCDYYVTCNTNFIWLLSHLSKIKALDIADIDIYLKEYDEIFYDLMKKYIKDNSYDLLYGATQIATYFLNRYKHKPDMYKTFLNTYLELLYTQADKLSHNKLAWKSMIDKSAPHILGYNLGLAHGGKSNVTAPQCPM